MWDLCTCNSRLLHLNLNSLIANPEIEFPQKGKVLFVALIVKLFVEALADKQPLDQHGGLFAFDIDCFKKEMKSTLRYECLVCFTDIPLLSFTHRGLAPTLGQPWGCKIQPRQQPAKVLSALIHMKKSLFSPPAR